MKCKSSRDILIYLFEPAAASLREFHLGLSTDYSLRLLAFTLQAFAAFLLPDLEVGHLLPLQKHQLPTPVHGGVALRVERVIAIQRHERLVAGFDRVVVQGASLLEETFHLLPGGVVRELREARLRAGLARFRGVDQRKRLAISSSRGTACGRPFFLIGELLDDWRVPKLLHGLLLAGPSPLGEQMSRLHGHAIDGVSQAEPHEGRYGLFHDVLVNLQHLKIEFPLWRRGLFRARNKEKEGKIRRAFSGPAASPTRGARGFLLCRMGFGRSRSFVTQPRRSSPLLFRNCSCLERNGCFSRWRRF